MMKPVPRLRNLHKPMIPNSRGTTVSGWISRKAFRTPEKKRRTSDMRMDLVHVGQRVSIGRKEARVVVELPDQRSVGIPVGPMQRNMAVHFVREVRIRFLHPVHRVLQAWITARLADFGFAHCL